MLCSEHAARRARDRFDLKQRSLGEVRAQVVCEARHALRAHRYSHTQPEWTILPGHAAEPEQDAIRFVWDAERRHAYCLLATEDDNWLVKTSLLPVQQVAGGNARRRATQRRERSALREQLA